MEKHLLRQRITLARFGYLTQLQEAIRAHLMHTVRLTAHTPSHRSDQVQRTAELDPPRKYQDMHGSPDNQLSSYVLYMIKFLVAITGRTLVAVRRSLIGTRENFSPEGKNCSRE